MLLRKMILKSLKKVRSKIDRAMEQIKSDGKSGLCLVFKVFRNEKHFILLISEILRF